MADKTPHQGHRERLRRRFLEHGLDNFAEHEALELLLFYAIARQDVNPLAHRLIEAFGTLEGVLQAPYEELCRVPGVGEQTAALLRLVYPLYGRARFSVAAQEQVLNTRAKIGAYLMARLAGVREERIYQLCLDAKGKLLACRLLGDGTVDAVSFSARRVLENAIQTRASLVALGHNHPSGVAIPSQEDIAATRSVADALRAVDIPLVDHVVVADNDFVSMADSGLTW